MVDSRAVSGGFYRADACAFTAPTLAGTCDNDGTCQGSAGENCGNCADCYCVAPAWCNEDDECDCAGDDCPCTPCVGWECGVDSFCTGQSVECGPGCNADEPLCVRQPDETYRCEAAGDCTPCQDQPCGTDDSCGSVVQCPDTCPGAQSCDYETNTCVDPEGCTPACQAPQQCVAGECVTPPDDGCQLGQACPCTLVNNIPVVVDEQVCTDCCCGYWIDPGTEESCEPQSYCQWYTGGCPVDPQSALECYCGCGGYWIGGCSIGGPDEDGNGLPDGCDDDNDGMVTEEECEGPCFGHIEGDECVVPFHYEGPPANKAEANLLGAAVLRGSD
jgi:hypothetical protein